MNLLEFKSKNKFTYQQLGKLFGVPGATVHHWIHANSYPNPKSVKKIIAKTNGQVTEEELKKFFNDCGKETRKYEEACPYCKRKYEQGDIF
jgi:hypothetical protein